MNKTLKKFIATILAVVTIFMMTLPAVYGMEFGDDDSISIIDDVLDIDYAQETYNLAFQLFKAQDTAAIKAAEQAASWAGKISTAFSVLSKFTTVVTAINGVVNLLKLFGLFGSSTSTTGPTQGEVDILKAISVLQDTVNDIDEKVDTTQETLTVEFATIGYQFNVTNYNHFKDDVWTTFYTNKVEPLVAYQNQFSDSINQKILAYAKHWIDIVDTDISKAQDIRSIYIVDENGEYTLSYSPNTNRGIDKACKNVTIDTDKNSVAYIIKVDGEDISNAINEVYEYVNVNNVNDYLIEAFEYALGEAGLRGELPEETGFTQTLCEYMYNKDADAYYDSFEEYANDLMDSLVYACTYETVNSGSFLSSKFATEVCTAYEEFANSLSGANGITSPLYAQLQMLALTHNFEGEIKEDAQTMYDYLNVLNISFASFAAMISSFADYRTTSQNEALLEKYLESKAAHKSVYKGFMTGYNNYCYTTKSFVSYYDATLRSDFLFTSENMQYTSETLLGLSVMKTHQKKSDWALWLKGYDYNFDGEDDGSETWYYTNMFNTLRRDQGNYTDEEYETIKSTEESKYSSIITSEKLELMYLTAKNNGTTLIDAIENSDVNKSGSMTTSKVLTDYETKSINSNTSMYVNKVFYPFFAYMNARYGYKFETVVDMSGTVSNSESKIKVVDTDYLNYAHYCTLSDRYAAQFLLVGTTEETSTGLYKVIQEDSLQSASRVEGSYVNIATGEVTKNTELANKAYSSTYYASYPVLGYLDNIEVHTSLTIDDPNKATYLIACEKNYGIMYESRVINAYQTLAPGATSITTADTGVEKISTFEDGDDIVEEETSGAYGIVEWIESFVKFIKHIINLFKEIFDVFTK